MALLPHSITRPSAMLKIPSLIAKGLSAEGIIRQLKSDLLSYRRTLMLSDIRSIMGIESHKDVLKYVRKDRLPSSKLIADVEWQLGKEYMYKLQVQSQVKKGEPLTERFVNIMSDKPLTISQVEAELQELWVGYEKYGEEQLKSYTVIAGYHRVEPQT
jgi:hypothetical protein